MVSNDTRQAFYRVTDVGENNYSELDMTMAEREDMHALCGFLLSSSELGPSQQKSHYRCSTTKGRVLVFFVLFFFSLRKFTQ